MQTAHAADQQRRVRLELINLAGFIGVADGAVNRIAQVNLPINDFAPFGRQRVFEIRHKDFYIRIERIDDHLALYRTGNFYPPILQIVRNAADRPITVTNGSCFRNKIRKLAVINCLLLLDTRGQEFIALRRKAAHQLGQKFYGLRR
jgi:hypothetical protein